MTEQELEHANSTNPCQGICSQDDKGYCIGCFRTAEERSNWYRESSEWRERVLEEIQVREQAAFD